VEQRIREAMENGEFDNLSGQGKPLPLNENPFLEPGLDLAFGLLQKYRNLALLQKKWMPGILALLFTTFLRKFMLIIKERR